MSDIRDTTAIQAEFDSACQLLGDVEHKLDSWTRRKAEILNRMRELGQEMHLARKVEAASAAKTPAHAAEPPRDPLVAPGSSAREVVAKRADDLKRALENAPPIFKPQPQDEDAGEPERVQ